MKDAWLASPEFAELVGVTDRQARRVLKGFIDGKHWQGILGKARTCVGRGGRSGQRYEVRLSSLPVSLQERFSGPSEPSEVALTILAAPPPKFIAAPSQTEEERRKFAVLRLIAGTEPRTSERRRAIEDAHRHHAVPVRTIERWVKRCDDYGWDLDAMGRKKPANSEGPRILVSREFDKAWRARGYPEHELVELGEWVTQRILSWWQSPVQRKGWKEGPRKEALTDLKRECDNRKRTLPSRAFHLSRRRVEEFRFHSIVDVMANDAKRFDDMKPRIRRNNALFEPMAQVVMDVKPLDCEMLRPDGTVARPKFIAFLDTGTMRITGSIVLLAEREGVRQEHVANAFVAMAAKPDWGFPQQLYRDNGSEYYLFDLIREALKMTAKEGVRVIVNAKPYSGASKPIESRFATIDRYVTSQMAGYVGGNIMNNKTQQVGKKVAPYPGTIEEFEAEFFTRLADLEGKEFDSGPFKGRSPAQIYRDHVVNGWRPVPDRQPGHGLS